MDAWEWVADGVGVVLVLVLCAVLAMVLRRRLLARHGAVFDLCVNVPSGRHGWQLGLGRYRDDTLEWFGAFSLSWRPRRRFARGQLELLRHREADEPESRSIYSGHLVAECNTPQGLVQLAMSGEALTALLAWLESAPPGQQANRVV